MHSTAIQCVFIIFSEIFTVIFGVKIKDNRLKASSQCHKNSKFQLALHVFSAWNVCFTACVTTDREIKPLLSETFSSMASVSEEHLNKINIWSPKSQTVSSTQVTYTGPCKEHGSGHTEARRRQKVTGISVCISLWCVFVSQHQEFGFSTAKQK